MNTMCGWMFQAGVVVVVSFGWLASCGGGGGASGGPSTTTIPIDAIQDGHTDGTTLTLPGDRHIMGDDAGGNDYVGLLRFPLAAVPPGATVVGAFLNISFLDRHGTPVGPAPAHLGDLQFIRIDGSAPLALGDYAAPALAHNSNSNLIFAWQNLRIHIGMYVPVASAITAGDTHLKLRLQFEHATNADLTKDQMEFAAIGHVSQPVAELEVITQP